MAIKILFFFIACFLLNSGVLMARYKMGEKGPQKIFKESSYSKPLVTKKTDSLRSTKVVDETPVLEDLSRTYQVDLPEKSIKERPQSRNTTHE